MDRYTCGMYLVSEQRQCADILCFAAGVVHGGDFIYCHQLYLSAEDSRVVIFEEYCRADMPVGHGWYCGGDGGILYGQRGSGFYQGVDVGLDGGMVHRSGSVDAMRKTVTLPMKLHDKSLRFQFVEYEFFVIFFSDFQSEVMVPAVDNSFSDVVGASVR